MRTDSGRLFAARKISKINESQKDRNNVDIYQQKWDPLQMVREKRKYNSNKRADASSTIWKYKCTIRNGEKENSRG